MAADMNGHPLAEYLKGKNKSEFARKLGLSHTQNLFDYLPRRDGRPPRRKMTADLARRIVKATEGALDFNALLAPFPSQQAEQQAA